MNNLVLNQNEDKKLVFKDLNEKQVNIELKDNSRLNLLYFSRIEGDTKLDINVNNDCNLELNFILFNDNNKIDLNIDILGSNTTVLVKTLSLALNAKKEFNVNIIHHNKDSISEVVNNGISFTNGHNVFNVVGDIKAKMSGSNARQITRGLILDKTGSCKVLPILLIDNYDVKAYHGATIGKINDEDLFYLMSRGLTKKRSFYVSY